MSVPSSWKSRIALSSLLGFSLFGWVAGCHSAEPSSGADAGLLAVSNFLHPPFSSRDESGRAVGLEVDLVRLAANSMSQEVEWQERAFSELLVAVEEGQADMAASTIGVTPERAKRVAFTDPYHTTTIIALTRTGPGEPRSLEELSGKRVGTERSTTAVGAAKRRIPEATRVLERTEGKSWAEMLVAKEIDAVVLDASHASKFMADAQRRFHRIREPLQQEHFAFAVALEADALRASLNLAIEAATEQLASPPKPITIETSDGGVLHGHEYGAGEEAIVLAHGGRFDKESWEPQARQLQAAGWRVLAFDFRGYGESVGGPGKESDLNAAHLDVIAAVAHLRASGAERVAILGGSFGGGAAARAVLHHEGQLVDDLLLLGSSGCDGLSVVAPRTLFVTTKKDAMGDGSLRLPEVRARYERIPGEKQLVLLEGEAHAQYLFWTEQGPQAMTAILRFLKKN